MLLSVLLQIIAAIAAIRLIRRTKYNSVWILFIVAFIALCFVRLGQMVEMTDRSTWQLSPDFFVWFEVVASFSFAVGTLMVPKIFNYIDKLDFQRRLTERRILSTVLRTEEKERLRFSKELHDGLGPLLSSAKMSLSVLAKDQNEQNKELWDNTLYVIDEAIRSLREISNNLSPHVLKDFGLARAIKNFLNKIPANENVKIRFVTNLKSERFETDTEVILYRVVCELVSNSIKHSGCSEINLSLHYNGGTLTLSYSDNGRGFEPTSVMDTGMGLSNITSRINSLKGSFQVSSAPSGGGMSATIKVSAR